MSGLEPRLFVPASFVPLTGLGGDDGDSLDFVVFRHQPRKITSGGDGDCLLVSGAGH